MFELLRRRRQRGIVKRHHQFWVRHIFEEQERLQHNQYQIMHRSTQNFNIPSPGKPLAFELLKMGLFKFPPPRTKVVFKCPTLSSDLSVCSKLLKTFFVSQSLTNAVSLPLNSSILFKRVLWLLATSAANVTLPVQFSPPHTGKGQIPHSPGTEDSQMPRVCPGRGGRGGNVEISI